MKLTQREIDLVEHWFRAAHEYHEKYAQAASKLTSQQIENLERYWALKDSEKDMIDAILDDLIVIAGCKKQDFKQLEKCWRALRGAGND